MSFSHRSAGVRWSLQRDPRQDQHCLGSSASSLSTQRDRVPEHGAGYREPLDLIALGMLKGVPKVAVGKLS